MKLRRLEVRGFRSLAAFEISFDESLTVVVGENDAGKTSLIECLKVVTQGRPVGLDDFTYGFKQLVISVEIDDFIFRKEYRRDELAVREESFRAYPSHHWIERNLAILSDRAFDAASEVGQAKVREVARILGFTVRSNSNIENLKVQIISKISSGEELVIENASFPKFNNIQLDGRQFENVPAFFKEVFLKEKQANIWREQVSEGTTIEAFVKSHLEAYSNEVSRQIRERGIIDKLRMFLRELTEVKG